MTLPNAFPTVPDPRGRRLAVIGDCPTSDDMLGFQPFSGSAGKLLRLVLDQSGILPQSCFFGNITQLNPPSNDIDSFDWQGEEIQSGIVALENDLARFQPNTVLSLGRSPFRYFKPDKCYQGRPNKGNPTGYAVPVQDWRGSVFLGTGGHKVVASIHPMQVIRSASDIAYFRPDIARAVRHSANRDYRPVERIGNLHPSLQDVLTFIENLLLTCRPASFDIEGYSDAIGVTMLSICDTPTSGIVIPFWINGAAYWSEEEEVIVWGALSQWLASPRCPKRCHNALYEMGVLAWRHSIIVEGIVDDTMFKHWECFNELEKSLGVCVSLWIEEPYYKDERENSNVNTKLNYNFKDSACTEDISAAMDVYLSKYPRALDHYRFNVSLLVPFNYMHVRGCRFDTTRAAAHRSKAEAELSVFQERIDAVTKPTLGHDFNCKSNDDKNWLLYDFLGHDVYKRYGRTAKEEVMLRLYNKRKDAVLLDVIRAVALRTRISDINKLTPHPDGRIRTSYGPVDTATGRLNSRETFLTEIVGVMQKGPNKGALIRAEFGTNMQNVTKPIRDTCLPDNPTMLFWQADLAGADAWTVAADLAALGEPRMLNDLKAGVKPAKVLLAMWREVQAGRDPSRIARMDSADAKAVCDAILIPKGELPDGRPADWEYTTSKKTQHGTNYDGQAPTIAATTFKDSDGAIDIPVGDVEKLQQLYRMRYNTTLRSRWMGQHLVETGGVLTTACGIRRRFFGIRNPRQIDDDIIRAALASEPQAITTNRTNVALLNLWNDPENRRSSGALFIEPLLQIHDAIAGQFPERLRDFARTKIAQWFNNPITIHGIEITIPVDIKVGPSWGECDTSI